MSGKNPKQARDKVPGDASQIRSTRASPLNEQGKAAEIAKLLAEDDAQECARDDRPDPELPLLHGNQPAEADQATKSLWKEADRIWDLCQNKREFRGFVAADYPEVYKALVQLRGRVTTVLEWGSGLGVVTIMASNLGFEAYGIESESRLVDCSRALAERYGPGAQFATGTFIPGEYEWDPEYGDDSFRSDIEAEPGYEELGMDLPDYDLVYAFPWPDEVVLFQDILRKCGRDDTLFLRYDAREGVLLSRTRDNR